MERTRGIPRSPRLLRAALLFAALVATTPTLRADSVPDMQGYTRPGKEAILDGVAEKEPGVGVTIYYSVYDRVQGTVIDPWNSGLKNPTANFVPGKTTDLQTSSRGLDSQARYLYLYQIVNDSKRKSQIKTATIRLLVDPADITSWGHFAVPRAEVDQATRGVGFTAPPVKEAEKNEARAVSTKEPNVSDANYRVVAPAMLTPRGLGLGHIPVDNVKRAADAPEEDIGREPQAVQLLGAHTFDVLAGHGTGGLGAELRMPGERGQRVGLVDWANPPAPIVVPARREFGTYGASGNYGLFSQLGTTTRPAAYDPLLGTRPWTSGATGLGATGLGATGLGATGTARTGRTDNNFAAIQASWLDFPLAPGQRSVVFGFTSNLPPVYDGVRLRANAAREVVGANVGAPDLRAANLASDGTVPTPLGVVSEPEVVGVSTAPGPVGSSPSSFGVASLAPAEGGGGTFGGGGGTMGGGGSMGGGLGGGMGGGMGGGIGGFGGFGGGTGNQGGTPIVRAPEEGETTTGSTTTGSGTQTQTGTGTQAQSQSQSQSQTVNVNVNNNVGTKTGNGGTKNGGGNTNNVIPEPAALVTAGLCLPVLALFSRRRKPSEDTRSETI